MSLFGKILALLNLVGAIALFTLASLSYSKRQGWQESALRHELALHGLPLNDKELDNEHKPRVARIDSKLQNDLFARVGAKPAPTQIMEITRIKSELDDAIAKSAEQEKDSGRAVARKSYTLARILRGLADSATERDQVNAALIYLKDNASLDALKARHRRAFDEAAQGMPEGLEKIQPRPTFPQSFQFALRTQGGEPSVAFSNELAKLLPATAADAKKQNFDKLFQTALEKQQADLERQYNQAFNTALGQAGEGETTKAGTELQKAAIARLLFGLAAFQTEEALKGENASDDLNRLKGLTPGTPAYYEKLADTTTFDTLLRRALVVSGPRAITNAILERTAALREMASDVAADAQREQSQFVSDNAALIRQLRTLADIYRDEETYVTSLTAIAGKQSTRTENQEKAAKDLRDELNRSYAQTKDVLDALRARSEDLLKNRQTIQDVIRRTEKGEEHLRYLEDLARKAESQKK